MPSTSCSSSTSVMVSRVGRLTSNERVGGGCHVLEMVVDAGFPQTHAGQFAMLSTTHPSFPLLPRPFSMLGYEAVDGEDRLEFMVMPVGVGSGLLCSLEPGESCQVVGPLGHALDDELPEGPLVAVAGGYGVAPFLFMAEQWQRAGDDRLADLTVVFGARKLDKLSLSERLADTGCRVELCTEDGSRGHAGRVDGRLTELLDDLEASAVLTCGPDAMMKAVGRVARDAGVSCRASLETVMGCGYAVCNGCAVGVDDPADPEGYTYHLACREGTIFDEARLQWHLL